ncbi:F-box domain [Arabidopsis thaliana x Arabidopsis arenosa]|uniref:F-box domain n=1 Tax=Arabidopsis thaliana x Arabidopsis arenosa TaxID=1240361 RepID=A0A8T2AZZ1_9BRAS|nr:F-box domain [Arabidopsis thaliana x Arabidopsis arenosa]
MKTQQQRDEDNDDGAITTVGNSNTESIPLDLTIEILKRLPAESIFRFRCVSKQWCSITCSRFFIDSFMSLSLSRPRLLFCCGITHWYNTYSNENPLICYSTPLTLQESNNLSLVLSKHDMPDLRINSPDQLMESCNSVRGILCISVVGQQSRHFFICNPTTRQVLRIPNEYQRCYMFLGYDSRKDQYKILRRVASHDESVEHSVCTLERGQIQSSSFSSWRHVVSNILYRYEYSDVVCINGVVYYAAWKKTSSTSFVIVSFDVEFERLLLIEAPKEEVKLDYRLKLINYKGKLALFYVHNDYSYILCVLDDIKKQIWLTKTGVLSSFCDLSRNLIVETCGTTDAGEICVVSPSNASELFFYDLEKNSVRRRVTVEGITEEFRRCLFRSCDHVDNIVSF